MKKAVRRKGASIIFGAFSNPEEANKMSPDAGDKPRQSGARNSNPVFRHLQDQSAHVTNKDFFFATIRNKAAHEGGFVRNQSSM
jgi:hypothetical protein